MHLQASSPRTLEIGKPRPYSLAKSSATSRNTLHATYRTTRTSSMRFEEYFTNSKSTISTIFVVFLSGGKPPHDHTAAVFCLLWFSRTSPHQRRPGFPSWSWTGWRGAIEFIRSLEQPKGNKNYKISATFGSENEVQLLQLRRTDNLPNIKRDIDIVRLRIHCRTISICYSSIQLTPSVYNASTAVEKNWQDNKASAAYSWLTDLVRDLCSRLRWNRPRVVHLSG